VEKKKGGEKLMGTKKKTSRHKGNRKDEEKERKNVK